MWLDYFNAHSCYGMHLIFYTPNYSIAGIVAFVEHLVSVKNNPVSDAACTQVCVYKLTLLTRGDPWMDLLRDRQVVLNFAPWDT